MWSETMLHWVTAHGYIGLFVLLVLGIIGIPIPDESVLAFAGYLIYKGDLRVIPTVISAFLGSACGITLSYALGRSVGAFLVEKYSHIIHVTRQKMDRVHVWFDRVGRWGLLFGFFLPGVRHVTAFTAGMSKLQLSVFALFTYTGGLLWSVTFISVGYYLGKEWVQVSEKLHRIPLIGSGIALALFVVYMLAKRKREAH